ncbi:hypothetical protein O6H91_01G058900 [Diphasiastrum complanatum]|uniref:Uncharacterized protein n=1 Tax=Diphasiastrum complanatum TaxID=34168 RepID=A0ACC2ER36_DIPCM|nr:hypothetical protein O6H91_01G058900 [Diphasiastrum complanatum]
MHSIIAFYRQEKRLSVICQSSAYLSRYSRFVQGFVSQASFDEQSFEQGKNVHIHRADSSSSRPAEAILNERTHTSNASNRSSVLLMRLERSKRGKSVLPIVAEWLADGNEFSREDLLCSIGRLRFLRRHKDALEILEWAMVSGTREPRLTDYVTYLDLTAKVRGLDAAAKYFKSIPHRFRQTDITHKTLLKNYLDHNAAYKAKQVLKRMTEMGFIKSPSMYNQVISLYLKKQKENRIPELLLEMKEVGISPDVDTYNIMMEMRSKKGDIPGMEKLFDRMQASSEAKPNVVTFSTLASTYISAGLHEKAEALLKSIQDSSTLGKAAETQDALIALYARLGKVDEVGKMWKLTGFSKISKSSFMYMIEAFCKAGQLELVEELFLEMEGQGLFEIQLANTVINILTKLGHLERAEKLFRNMVDKGCYPDSYTYHHFVTGYLQHNQPDKATEKIQQCLETHKFQRIVPLFETMLLILNLHADKGDLQSAENLFHDMKRYNYAQNVKVYNVLLKAYLKSGMHAFELTNRMALDQVAPNQETFALLEQVKMQSDVKEVNSLVH